MRPVHYAASGTGALAFACYFEELRAHLAAWEVIRVPGRSRIAPRVPAPRRTTDLDKVTCPKCWGEIARMASQQGA